MVNNSSLPNVVSSFVSVPFLNDNTISTAQLLNHCTQPQLVSEFKPPSIKFVDYRNLQLVLKSIFFTGVYVLKFTVHDRELIISCSCRATLKGVCIHICKTVEAITTANGNDYFAQLLPNGLFDLAFKYQADFEKKEGAKGIAIVKKKEVLSLYPFDPVTSPTPLQAILALRLPPVKKRVEKQAALGFVIMLPYAGRQPPFIIPASGLMNKTNERILSWLKFMPELDKRIERSINSNQLEIVKMGVQIMVQSDEIAADNQQDSSFNWSIKMLYVFNNWKRFFP
ncbi:hypothetical protein [Chitinophaga sp. MD30]|uniref:hypothetical protein n=1 Tax=Chitinophaga sp. MD30 TaxID=2033437 RepID=UPI000BAF155F|nr:hypothetical protein [Chitinophaga sp. MD30]ASZ13731.1 hypothetical protein CK934_23630 [Chitinophaga sp. MD30]